MRNKPWRISSTVFARSIVTLVNILDPDAIVIGGGLSNIDLLYTELPSRVEHYAFSPQGPTDILKNKHGDSSGVRGAAWLWPKNENMVGYAHDTQ